MKRAAGLATQVSGAHGTLAGPDGLEGGAYSKAMVFSPASSIYGGTDEIQRNIVAERTLGLPREPAPDRAHPTATSFGACRRPRPWPHPPRPGTASARTPREKPQQIADELRRQIVSGELGEGDLIGHEPELIERFGVSRPSLREALRILEAEGLISVLRGVQGGVVVHHPDQRLTARTAALVLQTRNVSLADVFEARTVIEPAAVRLVAWSRHRRRPAERLRRLITEQETGDRRPGGLRRRERPVPRGAGRPGRQRDDDDRRRDAPRGRHPGGGGREPGRRGRQLGPDAPPGPALPGAARRR